MGNYRQTSCLFPINMPFILIYKTKSGVMPHFCFLFVVPYKSTPILLHQIFQRNALEGHLCNTTLVENANGFAIYHRKARVTPT